MNTQVFIAKRRSLGMTQEQLAHAMGITVRQMVRIEAGDFVAIKYALAIKWLEHESQVEKA